MARDILKVRLALDRIQCHDEGDGWGDAEPYLWTVYFKIDGTSVVLADSLFLEGTATVQGRSGSHGNLGDTDVEEDENVPIPQWLGVYEDTLKPIPVPQFVKDAGTDDVVGIIGVVAILMEEDNVSDDGAEAGRVALVNGVRDALNELIPTLGVTNQSITQEDIDKMTEKVEAKIKAAIQAQQNIFENIWSWLNKDDKIGSFVRFFTTDELASGTSIPFSKRWKTEGDWELFGRVSATVLCPAAAAQAVAEFFDRMGDDDSGFSSDREASSKDAAGAPSRDPGHGGPKRAKQSSPKMEASLKAMREFRAKQLKDYPGLGLWWGLARRHTPSFAHAVLQDPEVRRAAFSALEQMQDIVARLDHPLPARFIKDTETVLEGVERHGSRRAGVEARRALSALDEVRQKTTREAFRTLSKLPPMRHPTMDSGHRIQTRKSVAPMKVEQARSHG